MERKTGIILVILLILALVLGSGFIRMTDVYPGSRGGYTTAEISSAVVVVNGGNILEADYDELLVRADGPEVLISILGSGLERTFNITVTNVDPDAVSINGSEKPALPDGNNKVTFTSVVPARLVKDIMVTHAVGDDNYSFAVLGDCRNNPAVLKKILADAKNRGTGFIIILGDMVNDGREQEYDEVVNILETSPIPVYTVPGNHDIKGSGRELYSRNFGMYYHSFDVGETHFIMLDNAPGYLGEAQMDWLVQDFNENTHSSAIVLMHMPDFDPRAGSSHAMTDTNEADALHSLFEEFNVDAVFTAHIHTYMEYTLDGVPYIITGGGGAPLTEDGADYHYILANVSNRELTTEMIAV